MTSPENLTFEQALAELEKVVRDLEDGQTGLEEALARYEVGVSLLRRCHGLLQHAEQRIVKLVGVDTEGKPLTQPFEHTAKVEKS
ncbi:MAG: exodeoxyribonuclease VII small subunit [Planctomycetes bacterium]|nr:exodeoxyribonuclease VII small subunit [Planctomycetota bacterium]